MEVNPRLASFPLLSLKERDRRWSEIRRRMNQEGLDALLIWGNNQALTTGLANFRYVTSIGCLDGCVFFPLDGDPVAFADSSHQYHPYNYFTKFQNWVEDVRPQSGAKGLIEAIRSHGLTNGRFGLVDRATMLGRFTMPFPVISKLKEDFASVEFVDAGKILDEVRMIKSDEEISYLRLSGVIARGMVAAMVKSTRVGAKERDVYAEMVRSMISEGGEDVGGIFFTSDNIKTPDPFLLHGRMPPWAPSGRILGEGDIVMCELHASYGGYLTQTERTISLGKPPAQISAINEIVSESFKSGLSKMRPEYTIGEAANAFLKPVKDAGMDYLELGFHGHGLGSPEFPTCVHPIIASNDSGTNLRIKENMVFASNIDIHDPRWRKDVGVMYCDTFVVKSSGVERLVNLDPSWISV